MKTLIETLISLGHRDKGNIKACFDAAVLIGIQQAKIAELENLTNMKHLGSIHKCHLNTNEELWCKDVLLYSPNNPGDNPERRVNIYTLKE